MSVIRDTSHVSIGPWGPSKHLPFGDSLRHVSTALLSCSLDCGENVGSRAGRKYLTYAFNVGVDENGSVRILADRRTAARIRQHVDNQHAEEDPKRRL